MVDFYSSDQTPKTEQPATPENISLQPAPIPHKPSRIKTGISKSILFLMVFLLLILFSLGGFIAGSRLSTNGNSLITPPPSDNPIGPGGNGISCTADALECPDGSFVGRIGPKCEFAKCPGTPAIDTSTWKIYTNTEQKYTVKYPSDEFVRLLCPDEGFLLNPRGSEKRETIDMATCARDGSYTIEIISNNSLPEPEESEYYSVAQETVVVDGISATKYILTKSDIESPFPDWQSKIYVLKNGKKYIIQLSSKEYVDIFNQIVSTFTFIN
jgi:hypothetical protein